MKKQILQLKLQGYSNTNIANQFDHKIPTSRGGDNSLSNLGVCTKKANLAKSDMTPDEFLEFCQKVIKYNTTC